MVCGVSVSRYTCMLCQDATYHGKLVLLEIGVLSQSTQKSIKEMKYMEFFVKICHEESGVTFKGTPEIFFQVGCQGNGTSIGL